MSDKRPQLSEINSIDRSTWALVFVTYFCCVIVLVVMLRMEVGHLTLRTIRKAYWTLIEIFYRQPYDYESHVHVVKVSQVIAHIFLLTS